MAHGASKQSVLFLDFARFAQGGGQSRRSHGKLPRSTSYGARVGFELTGGVEASQRFIDALRLFYHFIDIGGSPSVATHPASTTNQQSSGVEQLAAGVTPGFVRLSVSLDRREGILAGLTPTLEAEGGAIDAQRKAA